jgi:hypothetical protein
MLFLSERLKPVEKISSTVLLVFLSGYRVVSSSETPEYAPAETP